MEAFLQRLFTAKSDFPIWVRYVLTTGLVGIAFVARVMADEYLRSYPLLLFVPAIFLSSVLFGRGCGIAASLAASVLAATYLMPSSPSSAAIPLVLFIITGLCIAAVTELLRTTLRKLSEAKRYGDVLLQELAHRRRRDAAGVCCVAQPVMNLSDDVHPAYRGCAGAVYRIIVRQPCRLSSRCTHDFDQGTLRGHSGAEFAGGFDRLIVNELVTNCDGIGLSFGNKKRTWYPARQPSCHPDEGQRGKNASSASARCRSPSRSMSDEDLWSDSPQKRSKNWIGSEGCMRKRPTL